MILAICFSFLVSNVAFAQENKPINFSGNINIKISDYLSKEDFNFIKEMEKIYPYFDFDAKGDLILTKSIDELKKFNELNYKYNEEYSDDNHLVFTRKKA